MSQPYIIIPVHNRREFTLRCLASLHDQGILAAMQVIVVDDGSTDGTHEAVNAEFPQVILLPGDGNLFWTGAIECGMRHALAHGATSIVWLNDDVRPHTGAIDRVVTEAERLQGIASAQGYFQAGPEKRWFFDLVFRGPGGLQTKPVSAPAELSNVDACRGNLVAISRAVVDQIGYPDLRNIPHYNGDTDYTLRASQAGLPCVVVGDALFEELEPVRANNLSWLLSEVPLLSIWSRVFRKNSNFYPRMLLVYYFRHFGWRVLLQFPAPYLRLSAITLARWIVPRRLLLHLYARHSQAWQAHEWSGKIK